MKSKKEKLDVCPKCGEDMASILFKGRGGYRFCEKCGKLYKRTWSEV